MGENINGHDAGGAAVRLFPRQTCGGGSVAPCCGIAPGRSERLKEFKDLTGGDRIAARYLHKEFFEFTPTFKVWMYG